MTTPRALAAVLFLALAAPGTVAAQPPAEESGFRAGLRLGGFEMANSPDSYDAVYGDPMPMLGIQVEWQLRPRFALAASLDYGEVDGERVFPADPPIGLGIDTTLTYIPLHLTAVWRADRGGEWAWLLGAGPSVLSWDDDGGIASSDGTEIGGHLMLSLRRLAELWTYGGELRWSSFPDAAGAEGPTVTNFYDEDDLGGVSLHVVALRRF